MTGAKQRSAEVRRSLRSFLTRWGAALAGLVLGAATAVVTSITAILGIVMVLVVRPVAPDRVATAVDSVARGAVDVEASRVSRFLGFSLPAERDRGPAVPYLLVRSAVGLLGGVILFLVLYGFLGGVVVLYEVWASSASSVPTTVLLTAYTLVFGLVLLFLAIAGLVNVVRWERAVAHRFLGPNRDALRRRVSELSASRADVVAAVDEERRRIERDLHDGVQQRLVALGMLVSRARRAHDPSTVDDLLRQAHEESHGVLEDLRDVSWRVFPAALESEGLDVAVESIAARASVAVDVRYELRARPPFPVETAAYFVVSEAVTNAAKHSRAETVTVALGDVDGRVRVEVADDGIGGADATGAGLSGLARRVEAVDGTFVLHSPPGGPTTIVAELPCE